MGKILVGRIGAIHAYNIGGIRVFLDCHSLPGDYMMVLEAVIASMPLGGVFYDIGCHKARYSLPVAKVVGKEGKAVGFEPNPTRNKRTRSLIRINKVSDILELHEIALDMHSGYGVLYIPDKDCLSSLNRQAALGKLMSGKQGNRKEQRILRSSIQVKTERLDEYVVRNNIRLPNVIKIDVQGAEYNVLLGAQAIIEKALPILVVEVHVDLIKLFGYSQEQLLVLLNNWGYRVDTLGYYKNDLHIRAMPINND
jgi:FkbM family methyltransferase